MGKILVSNRLAMRVTAHETDGASAGFERPVWCQGRQHDRDAR